MRRVPAEHRDARRAAAEREEHEERNRRNPSNKHETRSISISVNGDNPQKALEDVQRRLMEAVKAGKMSEEDAKVAVDVLKENTDF